MPSKTAPAKAAPTVEEAEAEAQEAQALVDELTTRIRTGDTTVTPDELENARKLAAFSETLRAGAEYRAKEARLKAATDELDASVKDLQKLFADRNQIESQRASASEALTSYLSALDTLGSHAAVAIRRFTEARFAADNLGISTLPEVVGAEVDTGIIRLGDTQMSVHTWTDINEMLRSVLEPAGVSVTGSAHYSPRPKQD